ncbi:hypothetical protein FOZ60_009051 [Perkinsus olseni]|uniref:Uncharacterized protein n=1 Tax=Perkinsus olseni TaxID=32597 RepID=A0A7J6NHT5_PEROL|nr:hypothetical protein FOZ60_009051 [Perkinsus olseni]
MMNFVSTWLIPAQLLVITTAQDVGRFVHRGGVYNITYDVNEEGQIFFGFTSTAPPLPGSPAGTPPRYLGNYYGLYPLSKVGDNTYAVGPRADVASWYGAITDQLQQLGVAKAHEPLAGIQSGDLTTLTYTSGDTFTSNFRNETIEFKRIPYGLIAGEFEYSEAEAPHLKLHYRIRSNGAVGIQASCDGGSITPRFLFKLTRRDIGMPYSVRSLGMTSLYPLIRMVRSDCPTAGVKYTDLSNVVFATQNTIYVRVGGVIRALTRTN